MKEQPNYYSIIPAHIRYDDELKPMEIIMYGEITALANKYGFAYASNSYFAELYNVHKKTVSNWINHLKEKGYIWTVVTRNEDMSIKDRKIYINYTYPQKDGEGYPQKDGDPIHKKMEVNNTRINNTRINRDRDETSKSFQYISNNLEIIQSPLKAQQLEEAIKDFKDNKLDIVTVATDYCKENNKGINYLIKVLENWNKDGVNTKDKAIAKVTPKQPKEDDYLAKKKQELLGG
ncbi:helix-turn-helix domain-containing protein [Staphylococcus capitis]|uniref:helix-turn-helix domain-containing protein n=1 Tax=Staphylococcus capitis TaxID=29388 RepID=UPI0028784A86|nr:helix-turn-helix domain-containing protein [Staphylococcus capitis]MDS4009688.1 helix-turn-helix domain-containing protein [Staphylococcus capitis]